VICLLQIKNVTFPKYESVTVKTVIETRKSGRYNYDAKSQPHSFCLGYMLRLFCIAFTTKMPNQMKKTCYAQSAQIRAIRKKMVTIMTEEASKCDLKELVQKLIPEAIGNEIEKACQCVFPLRDTFIRKVKVLKKPKFDITKLMEMHGDAAGEDTGTGVARAGEEPVVEELKGSGGRL